jgi:hypothetical protein
VNSIVSPPCFPYIIGMDLKLNPRGNGACPLCTRRFNCPIRKSLKEGIKHVKLQYAPNNHPLEAVIHSCPAFDED